ncbi:MAG: inositol monophosphatase family protein, partial [Candidatus Omnitrophota bacterium]
VVYDPRRKELFSATQGEGACLNGKKINVSKADDLSDSLLATGFSYNMETKKANMEYFRIAVEKAQAVRRAGAAALDLCYVACGRLDGFWELGLSPWDTAAGQLIVKEAGGCVTLLNGCDFNVIEKEIVATNGKIHSELLSLFEAK